MASHYFIHKDFSTRYARSKRQKIVVPKLKTRKSVAKRVKITGRKKVLRRDIGQGHFNARNPGKVTRRKRSDKVVFKTDAQNILRNLPYST